MGQLFEISLICSVGYTTHAHLCLGELADYSMRTILGGYMEEMACCFSEAVFLSR